MTTILITGAGGYIGSTLVPHLLQAGHSVVAVDTFWFGEDLLPAHPALRCIRQDTRVLDAEAFSGVEVVIDLAALSNDPCGEAFTKLTWQINHQARVRTARLARQQGVRRYILTSSCSVYGRGEGLLDEGSPTRPLTTYARANLAAERDTLALSGDSFWVTALRLATLFGLSPRMRLDLVVNSMCYSAWHHGEILIAGGGTQSRPLLHVGDLAKVLERVIQAAPHAIGGTILNVGNDLMNVSINDVAESISNHFSGTSDTPPVVRHSGPQDLRSYRVDFTKLAKAIGWSPLTHYTEAIPELLHFLDQATEPTIARCYTLDWYRNLGELILADTTYPESPRYRTEHPLCLGESASTQERNFDH